MSPISASISPALLLTTGLWADDYPLLVLVLLLSAYRSSFGVNVCARSSSAIPTASNGQLKQGNKKPDEAVFGTAWTIGLI